MLSSIEEGKRHQAQSKGRGPRKIRSGQEEDDSSVAAASLSTTTSEAGSARGPDESFDAASESTENRGASRVSAMVGLEIVPYKELMKGPHAAGIAKKWKRRYIKVKDCATGMSRMNLLLSTVRCQH